MDTPKDTTADTAVEPPADAADTTDPDRDAEHGTGPLVEWVSGPLRGVVPVDAGGVVTLRLDGQPVLDLDLTTGGIGLWIDGRNRVQVALITDDDPPPPPRHLSVVDDPPPAASRHDRAHHQDDTTGEPR